jgi:hypothetical protein
MSRDVAGTCARTTAIDLASFGGAPQNGGGDLLRQAEKAIQPGNIECHRVGGGQLHGGRKFGCQRFQIA